MTKFGMQTSVDRSIRGMTTGLKEAPEKTKVLADECESIYPTLLTRGMSGYYIYCVDDELQAYIPERIDAITNRLGALNGVRIPRRIALAASIQVGGTMICYHDNRWGRLCSRLGRLRVGTLVESPPRCRCD